MKDQELYKPEKEYKAKTEFWTECKIAKERYSTAYNKTLQEQLLLCCQMLFTKAKKFMPCMCVCVCVCVCGIMHYHDLTVT